MFVFYHPANFSFEQTLLKRNRRLEKEIAFRSEAIKSCSLKWSLSSNWGTEQCPSRAGHQYMKPRSKQLQGNKLIERAYVDK